ncbi:DUF4913 domain-containing protein [Rathayibacter sp. SD072]|uniref:DUF4913 domain-containing protein n=1 Tax=Rathayibacter sp. SD072 TaxID=2781731 RepID=UPI001A95F3F5|nr:DUF4913 domain-containing protein [Rathayibacter sp. SD072]MBO0984876.1 DUF4913 domain-containing protein [Rathayibacter sp. SD072]
MSDGLDFSDEDDPSEPEKAQAPEPELFYKSTDEFVRNHLIFTYRRTVGRPGRSDFRWRGDWWRSEEAISRLEALWRSWENARQDPVQMNDWWINQCDRQMSILMSTTGPFAESQDTNKPGDPLPYTPPPPGFFPPVTR